MRQSYLKKHEGNFVKVIRVFQVKHSFFDLPMNEPAFPMNNFLLIPAKVVIYFPTVFPNFILFTVAIPERRFVFTTKQVTRKSLFPPCLIEHIPLSPIKMT